MQQIHTELQAEDTGYNIEILGINWNLSSEAGNDLMTAGRDLPWLQDTNSENVQKSWGAAYRDVVILDASSRPLDPPFNLILNDLSAKVNREALKKRLRDAARFVDSDDDGIGDDWEERFFGDLAGGDADDPDLDEGSNFFEYALGSKPDTPEDLARLAAEFVTIENDDLFSLRFRRRLGEAGGLNYEIQRSGNGEDWENVGDLFTLSRKTGTYDGSGTEEVVFVAPASSGGPFLFRVNITRLSR